jgi:hypothetical protein
MYITYNDNELFLTLQSLETQRADERPVSARVDWSGTVEVDGQLKILIQFTEESGLVHRIKTIAEGIQTPEAVIYERLNAYLKDYRQTEQAGIENTESGEETEPVPYDPDQIVIRRDNYSVFQVLKMITDGDLNLSPDFQRNLVWDNIRKSRLIESVLLGIPLPVFYFAENRDGSFNVVDGLQRLSTLRDYTNNGFNLKNLEYLKADCERKYFKEEPDKKINASQVLEDKYTRRIERAQLVVNVIEAKSPLKVKYDIFKRINEGGRPLNSQEIRNCMANNDTRAYLRELAKSQAFMKATGGSVSDVRMDAQELVLRFTAFYLQRKDVIGSYTGDMNSFLDNALEALNSQKSNEFNQIKTAFTIAMQNAYHLFGQHCFRKCLPYHLKPGAYRQLINKSLFTTWSIELYDFDTQTIKRAISEGEFASILAEELAKYKDYYWVVTTRTTDRKSLAEAFAFTRKLLQDHLPVVA